LVADVLVRLKNAGLAGLPVVVGGIIPPEDATRLTALGVARIYTPKDYDLNAIMADIVDVVERSSREAA
jgi:(2R)-ethylmalonyl-CoA mutase